MSVLIILWLCLITVDQYIHCKVITVNNNGSISPTCCANESCVCGSLRQALFSTGNGTVISITSQAIPLHGIVKMTPRNNVTITSSIGTTIMCNNTGAVACYTCSNFIIEGIEWDQCGISSVPVLPGIDFNTISNISIINCTFQHFEVCISVRMLFAGGSINVVNSKFMFNTISNGSVCEEFLFASHSSLEVVSYKNTNLIIQDSLFYHNGNTNQSTSFNGSLIYYGQYQPTLSLLITHTRFISNGFASMNIFDTATRSSIIFHTVNASYNKFGAIVKNAGAVKTRLMDIISSHFEHNSNGALSITLASLNNVVTIQNTTFKNNKGNADGVAAALFISSFLSMVNISHCKFYDNIGGKSIVHITEGLYVPFSLAFCNVSITSSSFVRNTIGSALYISKSFLKFYSKVIFQDNSATSGAAIYISEGSQISVDNGSTVQFINNTASLRGGAMYIDLTNCHDHGIVFINFTKYDSISFINNSAKHSGNSIYFNIPDSCDVIRDRNKNDSVAYVPYKFSYVQSPNTIRSSIAASPYEIQLCSPANSSLINFNTETRDSCVINNDVMLGQLLFFNPTVYDYFSAIAEATKFELHCINCEFKYRLVENTILVQNGSSDKINIISVAADRDLVNDTNITLTVSSVLSAEYKQITATLSLTLSSCHNGFSFNGGSQQCECYDKDDYLQCKEDDADIKFGYWFGVFSGEFILSLCHNDYCNFFSHRQETDSDFYNLPVEIDGQCNSHRTGVACGQCSEGYTLAYNSPDCISVEKCSPGMTVLVIILTILYWIVIITMLFGVAYFLNTRQLSPGYLYGIIFFYSIVDILLVTNLRMTDGVLYTATILSSFAKFNPQFFGRLCFIKDIDAIDQQAIHYCHVVFISIILIIIYIIAKCNNRALMYVNRCIVPVTCFVLLFSYTSVTSASLLLLRAMKFDGVDGLFTYLSPHLKYFANRHATYASVALFCVLLVTIGFPLLLVIGPLLMKSFNGRFNKGTCKLHIESFLKKRSCFVRIKQLLDQLQDCYKDQHRWFAAYYLICRLVIMLITYYANGDHDYMIYYLQTACVVITMTHIWIQPYKNDLLNLTDTVILLVMVLVVNISAFRFSTATTAGIAICLIIAPMLLLFGVGVKKLLVPMIKKNQPNVDDDYSYDARASLK